MECVHDWTVTGAWVVGAPLRPGDPSSNRQPVAGCDAPLELACRVCGDCRGIRCGTSRASKCEPCAAVYRGRVGRVAGSGLVVGVRGLFLTLTAPGAVEHYAPDGSLCGCTPVGGADLAEWNARASLRWNNFVRDLSRALGADYFVDGRRRQGVTYFRAAEVQRRGALHYHVLLRRVDGRPVQVSKSTVRALAIRHGFGHSVDVQRLEPGHASYVAKYVAKSADERRDVPWRLWRTPRGFRQDAETGLWVNPRTGEVRDPELVTSPSFRTWSASRTWGLGMGEVKADQQHHVLTLAELPRWKDRAVPRAWAALAVPVRPDSRVEAAAPI